MGDAVAPDPQHVYVVETGAYEQRSVMGVYASLEIAQAHWPDESWAYDAEAGGWYAADGEGCITKCVIEDAMPDAEPTREQLRQEARSPLPYERV